MKLPTTITILALGLLAGGCSTVELKPLGTEVLRNAQGHVIGQKETLCDCRSGEKLARIALYLPRVDERGEVIGYEELVRGGSELRDLNGRRFGARWVDLRSRASNPGNKGLTILVYSQPAERAAMAGAPSVDELIRLARVD
jgi:hypothetical protein